MVKMICNIGGSYKKYVPINKTSEKKRLFEKLTKDIYETLLGTILFYQKLNGQLGEWGYNQNP